MEISSAGVWSADPIVQTRFGKVEASQDADATWVWRAIPYAAPPLGNLRWRAPIDPAPWAGVRSERRFNGGCTQFSPLSKGRIVGSEDCLYLNVWRPQTKQTGLPVYVWIHGGGNSIGSSTMVKDYYGNRVASRSNMVFVSINYRLGPMGWFTTPALRDGENPADASGNYGTLDIIQALRWVHDNVAAFGGDPQLVTIAGESAGGMNVLSLLTSPLAHGLFARAVCESGAPLSSTIAEGDARSEKVIERLLIEDGKAPNEAAASKLIAEMNASDLRTFLRSQSAAKILRTYGGRTAGMIDNPAIFSDGFVLPRNGYETFADGTYSNKVPLIIGSNKEEVKLFLLLAGLPWRGPVYAAVAKYGSERWKATGVDQIARELTRAPGQPPIYSYRFDWGAPDAEGKSVLPGNWGIRLGAFHSLEVPFFLGTDTVDGVFNLVLYDHANKPGRTALSAAIMKYVASFARTGNPNAAASHLPTWNSWSDTSGGPKFLLLNADDSEPEIHMSAEELSVHDVMQAMNRQLAEPTLSETRSYLERSKTP
ncbi:MAG TPA: carboxylesterase family protein [Spirochaetia bacterium]|nr:carboxylesterase family protein [Spirochaetia bacterium]